MSRVQGGVGGQSPLTVKSAGMQGSSLTES